MRSHTGHFKSIRWDCGDFGCAGEVSEARAHRGRQASVPGGVLVTRKVAREQVEGLRLGVAAREGLDERKCSSVERVASRD